MPVPIPVPKPAGAPVAGDAGAGPFPGGKPGALPVAGLGGVLELPLLAALCCARAAAIGHAAITSQVSQSRGEVMGKSAIASGTPGARQGER